MPIHSLLYHDVYEPGDADATGFSGPVAARYKLPRALFRDHLHAIRDRTEATPVTEAELHVARDHRFALTFDDGGDSFLSVITDEIDEVFPGGVGFFFITTDRLNTPGFLTDDRLQELAERGHVIGSHSASHPPEISKLTDAELDREWSTSVEVLSDLLQRPITTGSIPGGYFSKRVARAAFRAGIEILFTSEPTSRVQPFGEGVLIGRYSVTDSTPAKEAAALANGSRFARGRQAAVWGAKKTLKKCLGGGYRHLSKLVWQLRGGAEATTEPPLSTTSK